MDVPSSVVPIEGQAKVPGAFPVHVTGVILLEDIKEVFDVVLVDILYPEVVDDKGKADGVSCMGPIAGGQLALGVSSNTEAFFEEFLPNDAGLGKSIHATTYYAKNVAVGVNNVS
jgi:hypothetical protein